MAKIDDLLKQKREIEKELEKEMKKQTKLGEDDLKIMGRAFSELIIPKYLTFRSDKKYLDATIFIDGDYYEETNTFVVKVEDQTLNKKILTITLKGE